MRFRKITPVLLHELTTLLTSCTISEDKKDLSAHSRDRSFNKAVEPELVIWPEKTADVSTVLAFANKYTIPVTAWGGGSSTEGNPIPVAGGIVLDMTRMNRVLTVFPEDLQVEVQTGIIGDALNKKLEKYNLFFPATPGSSYLATLGGMIANNAGGMHAIKYGVVGDWILQLEVVLANGDVIKTGNRSFKSVSGYDLTSLFTGSEGTLGVITKAVLKLAPVPAKKIALLVSFKDFTNAANASLHILQSGIPVAAIEYMDEAYMHYINRARDLSYAESPTLLIQFHGDKKIILDELEKIKKVCKKNHSLFHQEFKTDQDITTLWDYRRSGRTVLQKVYPTKGILSAEVGLPLSQIGNFLKKARSSSKKYDLQTIMFGHIGDGNFHGWALYDLDNPQSHEKVTKLNEELITFAIASGGTITGEHGLGIGKSKYLPAEHPTILQLMKSLKKLLDPKGILNPGKIFIN